ncbi:40S ribosomal protein S8-B [Nematostella vectensis]|uniref:40S ribosomal protein S8-B n=1 Tax=Nematostella vectensis TaxID=45351 RepID=UPI002076E1EA|nr:40S ribosomal protein S8-B [Nematostella vectensis]
MACHLRRFEGLISSINFAARVISISKGLPSLSGISINAKASRRIHTSGYLCGGRPKSFWRQRRRPADTRINQELPEKIKERKAYGGHTKIKALRVNKGVYTLKSQGVEVEAPILSVMHSFANKEHIERNVIVKGSIVQVDNKPFEDWFQEYQQINDNSALENKGDTNSYSWLKTAPIYAKVTSRPGQEGDCNGYILEGEELNSLIRELQLTPSGSTEPATT